MSATDETPNVLRLNKAIEKTGAAMDAFTATADTAGFDLGPDAEDIELALFKFFADPGSREESSAALRAMGASW